MNGQNDDSQISRLKAQKAISHQMDIRAQMKGGGDVALKARSLCLLFSSIMAVFLLTMLFCQQSHALEDRIIDDGTIWYINSGATLPLGSQAAPLGIFLPILQILALQDPV
jgi:hypothetical protein